MTNNERDAELLARQWHKDQVDKCGKPYIGHILRVVRYTRAQPSCSIDDVTAAWLHDLVEDTPVTLDDLRQQGFSSAVVQSVDALTRREGEANRAYVLRVAQDASAIRVKRADYMDNLDPDRLAVLETDVRNRLIAVMTDSQKILLRAILDRSQ